MQLTAIHLHTWLIEREAPNLGWREGSEKRDALLQLLSCRKKTWLKQLEQVLAADLSSQI